MKQLTQRGESVAGTTGSGGTTTGQGGKTGKKSFSKKDLAEAVRRLTPGGASTARVELRPGFDAAAEGNSRGRARASVLQVVEWGVNYNARKFNELRTKADERASELKKKLDLLRSLKQEQASLQKLCSTESREAVYIRELLVAIEKVGDEIDDRLHYRRRLEHAHRRLGSNQVVIDQHVGVLDTAHMAAVREYKEMQAMLRQIEAGHVAALLERAEAERTAEAERDERERALMSRTTESEHAAKLDAWREKREIARKDFASELRGDLSKEEELKLQQTLAKEKEALLELRQKHESRQKEAMQLEAAFVAVRGATGVNSFDEVVEKFQSQEGNRKALVAEKKEAEDRLSNAKRQKEALERKFAHLKASGMGSTEMSREIADQLEREITACRVELKASNACCERLENVLVALRQGAVGLYQRLRPFGYLLEGEGALPTAALPIGSPAGPDSSRLAKHGGAPVAEPPAVDSIDAVHLSEIMLSKMVEFVSGDPSTQRDADSTTGAANGSGCAAPPSGSCDDDAETFDEDPLPNPENNVRVKSSAQLLYTETAALHGGDPLAVLAATCGQNTSAEGNDAAKLSRGTGGTGGDAGADSSSLAKNDIAALAASNADTDTRGGVGLEDIVPTRTFLKLSSTRQHSEMLRRIEQDARKKRILERIELAEASDHQRTSGRAARKKAQAQANDRLSTHPSTYTPPAFTKTKESAVDRSVALLAQSPKLL